ncbi:MAG: valine--tRNA ligase [Peptococcaceae bacterium]|jgi:valyl-tRNA synthetase|nr:valine--tRNA ligase [Peptococcaceae bacterium]
MCQKDKENLATVYGPKQVENRLYERWRQRGYFRAGATADAGTTAGAAGGSAAGSAAGTLAGVTAGAAAAGAAADAGTTAGAAGDSRERFAIVMPPPNVTGSLHLGHAMDETEQDILTRWRRMQGRDVLWLPGTDHAGIATQAKVEEKLAQEGKSKYDLGREEFLRQVWQWKDQYHDRIARQLGTLGCSCDWGRERFTLDEGCSRAVREVFVTLYEKNLIYQGDYLVNWCPKCRTTISDIEVEHENESGFLWHIRYPVKGEPGCFAVVATTRPETMLGDTAVAVHPEDARYADLVGKTVILPLLNREIPIIADRMVDPAFGTGAVKITPAHDINDFETGLRHGLAQITVLDENARMTELAGPYAGLDRYAARERIVADLTALGLLEKIEDHQHAVGHCYRCDTVVEPRISRQWFVKMRPLAAPAIQAVKDGRLRFVPARFAKVYLNWMENVRDWCVSRQLWWGHRIPVWYCGDCGAAICRRETPAICPECGRPNLKQDPDVLDTWFSSGLWPFSTLGWPENTADLRAYYPTSVLVTGRDIIFFWVARMAFLGLEFMGEVPFRDVLIHGLILDSQGRKMSKSLGNGIDPIELIDAYGADTLRFTLMTGTTPGNDLRFQRERLEATRNFCNKIWNASRFTLMNLAAAETGAGAEAGAEAGARAGTGTGAETDADADADAGTETGASGNAGEAGTGIAAGGETGAEACAGGQLALADRWITSRFHRCALEVTASLEAYDLGAAAQRVYEFLWDELCDWYIELIKPRLYGKETPASRALAQRTLTETLRGTLSLLHPFMPFITEELWQHLPHEGETIMLTPWPAGDPALLDEKAEAAMGLVMETVKAARNLRSQFNIGPGKKADLILLTDDPGIAGDLAICQGYIAHLAAAGHITLGDSRRERPRQAATAVVSGVEIFLPLAGLVDMAAEAARLKKEAEKIKGETRALEGKLANGAFLAKAPAEVIAKEEAKLADARYRLAALEARLTMLED